MNKAQTYPPGLNGLQLLPRLRQIQQDTLGFLLDCADHFGDLVYFQVGRQPVFFINHPDYIRHVLQDNNRNYSKDTIQYNSLAKITGRGLLTSDGSLWLRQRRLEQPAFARPRLMALDQVIVPATRAMLDRWQTAAGKGEAVDVDGEMMRLTLEIVGKALFSIDLSRQAQELTGAVLTTLDHIVHLARNPLSPPEFIPTPRNLRFRRALRTLDAAVYAMMAGRRQAGQPGEDMLGMLLQARDSESGRPMSDQQIRDEIITLLIAGHETVASALTWSWYLLALTPGVWQNLRAEVEGTLSNRLPGSADLDRLSYTGQVFSEALRLYPPAWLITRRAIAADELRGYPIPPGALMIISPYVIHRHPGFWPQPEEFAPERFSEEAEARQPRYAYIPFGGGPRLCIGSNFARVEGKLILAMVTQRFRLELLPEAQVQVDALVTLRPHGGLEMIPRLL